MLKRIIYSLCIMTVLFVTASVEVRASHFVGADLTYTYTGTPNTFLLRFRFYRDCSGITAPTQINLCYSSTSCGLNGTVTLLPIPNTGQPINANLCIPPVVTTCNGGTGYGVQEWIFEGTVTLPQACNDWLFAYEECCRNIAVSNIIGNPGLYISTFLDNLNYPTNSSPDFINIPVTQFCLNSPFYYSQGASDIDGDSLSFEFAPVEDAGFGCPYTPLAIQYQTPYTYDQPFSSAVPFTIDSTNGLISFTPNLVGTYVMAVLVKEWRNGIQIGFVKRDIQVNVISGCTIVPPQFTPNLTGPTGGIVANCGDTSLIISFVDPIQCASVVPTDVRATTPSGLPNPVTSAVAVGCQNSVTDSIQITLLTPLTAGVTYLFTKVGFDGNTFLSECGTQMPEYDSIRVTVVDNSIFTPPVINVGCVFDKVDVTFPINLDCNTVLGDGSDVTLTNGTTTIPVTSVTEYCNAGITYSIGSHFIFNVAPGTSASGPLYLLANTGNDANTIASACGTFRNVGDTLAVINVLTYIPVNLGNDTTVCQSSPAPLLDAGISGVNYVWTDISGTQLATTQTYTASASGTYIVNVSQGSCAGSDTIVVNIIPAPSVNLGNDINLCTGNPIPSLDAGNPGATFTWYLNGSVIGGATQQIYQPAPSGTGTFTYVVSVSNGGTCVGLDTVLITINSNLTINLGGDQTLCSNNLPTLDAGAITGGGTYVWSFNSQPISGATSQTYQATQTGTYSVLVTNAATCTGTASVNITIVQVPTASLGANQTICISDPMPTLDANYSGATNYIWSLNGSQVATTPTQTYQPANPGSGTWTYSVVVNNGNNCTATASVQITINSQVNISLQNYDICSGNSFPTLDAGSFSGATFVWTDAQSNVVANSQTYTPTAGGTYTVSVTQGSCSGSASSTINVVQTPTPQNQNYTKCNYDQFPLLDAGAFAGAAYVWTDQGSNVVSNSQSFTPSAPGTYTVTVTVTGGSANCTGTATHIVVENQAPVFAVSDVNQCEDQSAFTFNPGVNGTYNWILNGTSVSTSTSYSVSTPENSGTLILEITDNGCIGRDTANVTINKLPGVSLGTDQLKCNTDSGTFNAGNPGAIYSWTGPSFSSSSQVIYVTEPGTYTVTVTDANNCSRTVSVNYSEKPCDIDIPNVFTPNGDAANQFFHIANIESYPENTLIIYNRWGNKVYEKNSYTNDWDGKDAPDGVYFYTLKYRDFIDNTEITRHGSVTIIR